MDMTSGVTGDEPRAKALGCGRWEHPTRSVLATVARALLVVVVAANSGNSGPASCTCISILFISINKRKVSSLAVNIIPAMLS